ncbi:MAG: succinate dehydrogenase, cytochrome b556 subunit [Pseudomonadota bacterium]|nr:succinate dehydrogenase, cytochrome b556 subunit [Pseudomonadota bacterium]
MPDNGPPVVKRRPVYLNLVRIRLPLPGIVSFLHRVSGAALFLLGIPLALFAIQTSLDSADGFASIESMFAHPLCKLAIVGLLWAYLHHFFAGIRFLLIDLHIGDDLGPARQSSVAVLGASLLLTLLIAVRLW